MDLPDLSKIDIPKIARTAGYFIIAIGLLVALVNVVDVKVDPGARADPFTGTEGRALEHRISVVETHILYIREALERIEKKLGTD